MHTLWPSWPLLSAFMLASLALAMTPGPGVLYIVTRSLAHGRGAGVASVAGVALGNLGNAIAASVGLAALFAISALAFSVVKYAGALYLIFLGIRTLRRPRTNSEPSALTQPTAAARIFYDGFIVALLNPKTAVFFAAFLPQFLSAKTPPVLPSIALSAVFVAIAAATDTAYALTAGTIAPALRRAQGTRACGRYFSASALIGLAAFTAFAGSRHGK
jgi:threonine/homoserine/homoserine lactone efflux protein